MREDARPFHERDPRTRFTARAESYAAYRPSYPAAAIDAVIEGLGDPAALRIADVGAGTGISARLLGERGAWVYAIEPNAAMRSAAQLHARVRYLEGTAEQSGLDDACVDLVTAFQAYHWFDPQRVHREFRRILVPRGRVALVWNVRDPGDAFTRAYGELIAAAAVDKDVERRHGSAEAFTSSPFFGSVRTCRVPHEQHLDLRGLIGRMESTSYVPHEGAAYQRLLADFERLHARFADTQGIVALRYRTEIILGDSIA